ncbi:MAG: hypothetical protein PHQ18_02180 [Patescibacteria group bacterium]|nr:hypothetical protein [Patescibacteria group bacterium]
MVVFSLFFFVGKVDAVQQKVTSFDMGSGDNFGKKVAMYGDYAVVTSPNDDDMGSASGSAYVYHWNGDVWEYTQKLVPTGLQTYDYFGSSVAISDEYIAIGATGDDSISKDSGAVYVYSFDNIRKIWSRPIKLTPEDFIDDSRFNGGSVFTIYDFDGFGESVSILDNNLFVGAPTEDSAGINAGAVYRYFFDGGTWKYIQKIIAIDASAGNKFGNSLSSNGMYMAVGSKFSDENGKDSGAAYIFTGNVKKWYQQYKIVPEDGANEDYFGFDVAIHGDLVAVSSNYDDDVGVDSGSVYVFQKNNTQWLQSQKITARDGQFEDFFGTSVDINGNRLVVGSKGVDDNGLSSGSMYKYYLVDNVWSQEEKIIAYDGQSDDVFGGDVAVYDSTFLVGAYGDDDGGSNAGSAYFIYGELFSGEFEVYEADTVVGSRYGSVVDISGDYAAVSIISSNVYIYHWNGATWVISQVLSNNDTASNFGYSLDFGGGYLIVGAKNYKFDGKVWSGAVYIYKLENGLWVLDQEIHNDFPLAYANCGNAVSITDTYAIMGCFHYKYPNMPSSIQGTVFVFKNNAGIWEQVQQIVPELHTLDGVGPQTRSNFGVAVSIRGDKLIIGDDEDNSYKDSNKWKQGSIRIYGLENGLWLEEAFFHNTEMSTLAGVLSDFGTSVDIENDVACVGNAFSSGFYNKQDAGKVICYKYNGSNWDIMQEIALEDSESDSVFDDQFGRSVVIDNGKLIVGAEDRYTGNIETGVIFVYKIGDNDLTYFDSFVASDAHKEDDGGIDVGISGDRIIFGALRHKHPNAFNYGAAYIKHLGFQY